MRQHFYSFSIGRFRMGFLSFTFTMFYFGGETTGRCGINESTMVVKARTITIMRDFLIV